MEYSQASAMNVNDSLTVNGVPIFGGALIGMSGAQVLFVDPTPDGVGNDNNIGTANAPLQTLAEAHDRCVDGRGDIVVLIGGPAAGNTTDQTARQSTTLVWSKNNTHLIGIGAPTMIAQRSRISTATGATANLDPLMSVTGNGCIFSNFSLFQGVGQASTDEHLFDISGSRNYFWNIQFGGMGSANGAARAGSYCIELSGSENTFERCEVGLETRARTAANASVRLAGSSAQRNRFLDCVFPMYSTANTPLYVDANTSGILNGSTMLFKNCEFLENFNQTSSTQPAVTCTVSATVNGTIYFNNCHTAAAKWCAASACVKVASAPVSNGFNGGVAVSAADS